MIRRPTSRRWINSIEAHLGQIKRIDKHVDHTNGVALADEIIEAFGQQGRLPAIWPRNEALHPIPPTESRENHSGGRVFTQPGSETEILTASPALAGQQYSRISSVVTAAPPVWRLRRWPMHREHQNQFRRLALLQQVRQKPRGNAMRKVMLVTAAVFASVLPGASANAAPEHGQQRHRRVLGDQRARLQRLLSPAECAAASAPPIAAARTAARRHLDRRLTPNTGMSAPSWCPSQLPAL